MSGRRANGHRRRCAVLHGDSEERSRGRAVLVLGHARETALIFGRVITSTVMR